MNFRNISKNVQKNEFEKLRSDYIFKKIISFMKRNKSLVIMKYNKKLQKRLNISINDYKEYSEIEIELKLLMENMVNLLIYLIKIKNIIIFILITLMKKLKEDIRNFMK